MKKRSNPATWGRTGLIGALDVGSTKVCCLIARQAGAEGMRVIGMGHQASKGIRGGTLVDLDAAETVIRATVETAELMAGENIRPVVVNVSAGAPRSRLVAYEVAVGGHEIGDGDLRRILDPSALVDSAADSEEVVHGIPVGYTVDGCRGVRDPRGMYGERLGVNLHVVTASSGPLRNLNSCVERCHLEVADRAVSSYASALGCLVDDERALGVTLIDMGGGTTSLAVFFDTELVYTDAIPVGGSHVTSDIARGLSTPLAQAERLKTLFGSCLPTPSDDRQLLEVAPIAGDSPGEFGQVPRSVLVSIIRPRLEEIFEMVRARLQDAGFDRVCGRRVVITGGASQITGTPELAGMILDKQVRIGRPRSMPGLPDAATGPAFSTCVGLLRYASDPPSECTYGDVERLEHGGGRLSRIGQWFRENF